MGERSFRFEFAVFTGDDSEAPPAPDGLLEIVKDHVKWERIRRADHNGVFQAPRFAPDPEGTLWTALSADQAREVAGQIERAQTGWLIRSDKVWEDLTPLQAGMGLAAAILQGHDGLAVVDRETLIGYSAEDFVERASELNDEGDVTLCDLVRVDSAERGEALNMRTVGMNKFGHHDLAILNLPRRYHDFGVWMLCQTFGRYAALQAPLLPGQNFAYTRADPCARLFFQESDGLLAISDGHPTEKQPVPGLRRCITTLFPSFLVQQHQMTSDDEQGDDDAEPISRIDRLDDYVQFSQLLHEGRTDEAFATYGVTWETLAPVTYEWTARLSRDSLSPEFDRHFWAPPLAG
jgi:hypothetical protein